MAEYIINQSAKIQASEKDKDEILSLFNNDKKQTIEDIADQNLITQISEVIKTTELIAKRYLPEPKDKSNPQLSSGSIIYPRDRKVSVNALCRANFVCEIDENHPSFIRKGTTPYIQNHIILYQCHIKIRLNDH